MLLSHVCCHWLPSLDTQVADKLDSGVVTVMLDSQLVLTPSGTEPALTTV